jgi:hypothetical protein
MVWSLLQSEYQGKLEISLTGKVSLEGPNVVFEMQVRNDSGSNITSVEWPVIGALQKPTDSTQMRRMTFLEGTGQEVMMSPTFENERGYWGTNYPMQIGQGRYNLVLGEHGGLYIGTHDTTYNEVTQYSFELRPGYSDSLESEMPRTNEISGHSVRIVASVVHPSAVTLKPATCGHFKTGHFGWLET